MQAVLSEFLEKQELDRHLDSDEAIVLGAALQAANISDGFKLNRKMGMIDGVQYGVVLKLEGANGAGFQIYDDAGLGADQPLLVPRLLKKVPSKVWPLLTVGVQQFTYSTASPVVVASSFCSDNLPFVQLASKSLLCEGLMSAFCMVECRCSDRSRM